MCAREGARLVFAPSAAEMYPGGKPEVPSIRVRWGSFFEGEFRPGFFGGVLTVVLKLLRLTRQAIAVFGQKDAQQLALVRRMVTDLDLDVVIEPVPTVRDADGLATSSRNRYLSAADRAVALALPRALLASQARAAEVHRARARCSPPPGTCCAPNPPWRSTTSRWSTRARWAGRVPGLPCWWRRPGRAARG